MVQGEHSPSRRWRPRDGLLSMLVGPEGVDFTKLRDQVEANTAQVEATSTEVDAAVRQVEHLAREIEALPKALRERSEDPLDHIETVQGLYNRVYTINGIVVGLSERVHLDHQALMELQSRLERLTGSVQDMTAYQRRLKAIEDRLARLESEGWDPGERLSNRASEND